MIAGGVAGGLGLLWWLVIVLAARLYVGSAGCQQLPLGCLGMAVIWVLAALAVMVVLAWPLLHLAGVRPAWPVALAAPLVAVVLARAYQAFAVLPAWSMPGVIVVPAAAYGAAALVTAPGARRGQIIGLAVAIIALYPLTSLWSGRQQANAAAASLAEAGLPLLAAELPGYRITGAGAENPGRYITYSLVPVSAPPELTPSMTIDNEKIDVLISHPGPLFAPPAHCASSTSSFGTLADSPPCQPYGHGLWLQRSRNRISVFTRSDGAIVELDADAHVTPEAAVITAAEHLAVRPASYFPSGP